MTMFVAVILSQLTLPYSGSCAAGQNCFQATVSGGMQAGSALRASSLDANAGLISSSALGFAMDARSSKMSSIFATHLSDAGTAVGGVSYSIGVYGISSFYAAQDGGIGVRGEASSHPHSVGVSGFAYTGVQGYSTYVNTSTDLKGVGVAGYGNLYGVYGSNPLWVGVAGEGRAGMTAFGSGSVAGSSYGLSAGSSSDNGVQAYTTSTIASGVYGNNMSTSGFGVAGRSNAGGVAVLGDNPSGVSGRFTGNVTVAGTLTAASKMFEIDHPANPDNMILRHISIESSEYKNIYDGVVTLNSSGVGVVNVPSWMESLNENFRYQLTCVGGYAPVYVATELSNGSFTIGGGVPNLKVSWQLSGTRKDAYAVANPLIVEEFKAPAQRGRYLQPQLRGANAKFIFDLPPSTLTMTPSNIAADNGAIPHSITGK